MSQDFIQNILMEKISGIQKRIPIQLNLPPALQNQFQTVFSATTEAMPSLDESKYDAMISNAAQRYRLSPALIKAVIKAESAFNPTALSRAGAQGLMQLMPDTARSLGVGNAWDPQENINGGAKYLRQMLDRYDEDLNLALAAYNAGPGNVDAYQGVPPFQETRQYIQRIKTYLAGA